eukprot:scaffold8346_cov119-Isochrysis_galbana.AAC.4
MAGPAGGCGCGCRPSTSTAAGHYSLDDRDRPKEIVRLLEALGKLLVSAFQSVCSDVMDDAGERWPVSGRAGGGGRE